MVKVGVAGGSGYGGLELIHILLRHPEVEIAWLSSQQHSGKRPGDLYPNLRGFLDLKFSALDSLQPSELDVLFLGLPHGQAMKMAPELPDDLIVIDLSGDFRISDPEVFKEFYGFPLTAVKEQQRFAYGLPEINREAIRRSRRVANPGCFATATILALHPLVREEVAAGPIFVDSKTGSSGAGNSPGAGTHHPRRANSLFPYKPFRHPHLPEIEQALGKPGNCIVFQPYSAPFVRGIFASHYLELRRPWTSEEIAALYQRHYGSERFLRWVDDCPDVNFVRHSNFVDIGAAVQGRHLIVWSVLDNLQKGAAGQAVQNMNLVFGWPEPTALDLPPVHP
jgi:N-acetyl-gamma-glutamyl-phosphate reductase